MKIEQNQNQQLTFEKLYGELPKGYKKYQKALSAYSNSLGADIVSISGEGQLTIKSLNLNDAEILESQTKKISEIQSYADLKEFAKNVIDRGNKNY